MEPHIRAIGWLIEYPLILLSHVKPTFLMGARCQALAVRFIQEKEGYDCFAVGFEYSIDLVEVEQGVLFIQVGLGWSSLSNTPFRRHKTWVHEGGIATPLIVHWPKGISAEGELRHTPGHVVDIVPTLLDVTEMRLPTQVDGKPLPHLPGKSLIPVFAKDGTARRESIWWLHEGKRALRVGNWKIVAAKDKPSELYDLSADRSEANNLAKEKPLKVRELANIWARQFEEYTALATQGASTEKKRQ
jgi:arylsulfatase